MCGEQRQDYYRDRDKMSDITSIRSNEQRSQLVRRTVAHVHRYWSNRRFLNKTSLNTLFGKIMTIWVIWRLFVDCERDDVCGIVEWDNNRATRMEMSREEGTVAYYSKFCYVVVTKKMCFLRIKLLIRFFLSSICFEHLMFIIRKTKVYGTCSLIWYVYQAIK